MLTCPGTPNPLGGEGPHGGEEPLDEQGGEPGGGEEPLSTSCGGGPSGDEDPHGGGEPHGGAGPNGDVVETLGGDGGNGPPGEEPLGEAVGLHFFQATSSWPHGRRYEEGNAAPFQGSQAASISGSTRVTFSSGEHCNVESVERVEEADPAEVEGHACFAWLATR